MAGFYLSSPKHDLECTIFREKKLLLVLIGHVKLVVMK